MKSNRKKYFTFTLILFGLSIMAYLALQWYTFLLNKNIQEKNIIIEQQNKELENYKTLTGFTKLIAIKSLEEQYNETPRSTHINKIITMLQEIKTLNQSWNDILLSDFNVDLEKISVRWEVSNLNSLYYSDKDKWIISLIDRFKDLDFIENLYIKNYTKKDDSNWFSFILEANVIKDGK